jgi:hypothetical protein
VSERKVGQKTITGAKVITDNGIDTSDCIALVDVLKDTKVDTY